MRRSLFVLLAVVVFPASAAAAPVLVLGRDGRALKRNDPYLTGPAVTPAPARAGVAPTRAGIAVARIASAGAGSGGTGLGGQTPPPGKPPARKPRSKMHKRPPQKTVLSELLRLYRARAIDDSAYLGYVSSFKAAVASERRLSGTRASELKAVTTTMHGIAASGQLTASRLPALFAILDANRRWWTTGPLLSYGQRVEFAGSQLVWEYYPGQGIQLQVLGSFGKADGLYTSGRTGYPAMEQLLSELIPLAADRGGALVWEYYFSFDGGPPPWTSAMSQATGLEALSRAYEATHNNYYLQIATRALPIFSQAPPVGVGLHTSLGERFIQYTFAPQAGAAILNAFLQTLIGLYDYAHVSGDKTAATLFAAGNAEAMAEVPSYDAGGWSLYQPGVFDSLSYHELVTGFLSQLCTRTRASVYCATAHRFHEDLVTPPALVQLTLRSRTRRAPALRFSLSKYARVGIVVSLRSKTVLATSADFPNGVDSFPLPKLKHAGEYSVVLTATDLAGNFSRITGTLAVTR